LLLIPTVFKVVNDDYGIDWNGPIPYQDDCHINIPETPCPLSAEQKRHLVETVNPLNDSNYFGLDICLQTKEYCQTT
jgi:hypothetical protein